MASEVRAYDMRTMREHRFQPRIRHIVMVLEGQCPLCEGLLGTAVEQVPDPGDPMAPAGPQLVARCDTCWLDFIGNVAVVDDGRHWALFVFERDAPAEANRPTDAS